MRKAPPPLRSQTLALIETGQGPVAAPVRAVLFGEERFRQHGRSLAEAQRIERRRRWTWRQLRPVLRSPHFFPRIAANLRSLERSLAYLELMDRETEALSPAAEWLLDNHHLIEAQVPEIHNGLPHSYYASLPKLREPPLTGLPRVYGIAWAFVAHTDSNFDAHLLSQFLLAYQQVDPLTLGELWAVPTTLRVVLLENLARLAEAVAGHRAAQEAADWCCDQAEGWDDARLQAMFERARGRGLQISFVAQMLQRTRAHSGNEAPPWDAWLKQAAPEPDATLAAAHALHAADNVSVSNAVSALHAINSLEWRDLVARVSPVMQTLQRSPAFCADSELTRDNCSHAIERLARRLKRSEISVAEQVLALTQSRSAHPPCFWLIGEGRASLVAALGGSLTTIESPWLNWPWRIRGWLYALALLLGSAVSLRLLFPALAGPTPLGWPVIVTLPLAAMLVFEAVLAVVNRVLAESVRVHRLPRLALDEGLRPEDSTLLVIPCMLVSSAATQALAHRLEQHYLANPESHLRFALLSDWADAPQASMAADAGLLNEACAAIEALNQRHPSGPANLPRFGLLHRPRLWNDGERVWMGWERKRGKLEQLLALLVPPEGGVTPAPAQLAPTPFIDLGPLSRLEAGTRYLLTLDSDTELPPGVLRELVSIAAHPLNQPCLDPQTQRVISGYGILQPRVAAPFPESRQARDALPAFGWLFSGPWGLDVYNAGSSEIYQDIFGSGSFSGKGLLNVAAMHRALRGRVAQNRLLSHDLYEGIWARAAHLSDVTLIEAAPVHPAVAASRTHRWTRGDWQLLALFAQAWRGRIGMLNCWKMLDNLRRSLLPPAAVALLWCALALNTLRPWVALCLVAAAFGLGPLLGALAALLPGRRDLAMRHFLFEAGVNVLRVLGCTLWQLATLVHSSAVQLDAIARALWRMGVSRQLRLQWTTAAQAQAQARLAWGWFWHQHYGLSLLALAWGGAGLMMTGAQTPWLLACALLWAMVPAWLWWSAQPLHMGRAPPLAPAETDYLQRLARDTWSLFEAMVTAADHHLPPDNLQLEPEPILARRTSPTNIGLYLLSCVCAQRFGFIALDDFVARLLATLTTLERLPRERGHFHNWIDTATLQTLLPAYVSTVDSGNLAAALWAVAQACRDLAEPSSSKPAQTAALLGLATRMDALCAAMDFGFLYDPRRRLFRIGYRPGDASLDSAYYDLLASESRLGSFVAIAKGDVPLRHWQALGRPFLAVRGMPALRSWSGSMFEYLMPSLLMREPPQGLLQRATVAAVQAQQDFGARNGLPWGVSECAYFEQDASLAFQYGPFGVPELALRRTPQEDRVIAPYASALALLVDAPAALANLRALERLGARDRHGFIEALDFSRPRLGDGAPLQRVATYMAHHQGMSLLSLCNLLCDEAPRSWFERVPQVQAFGMLLHERMPSAIVYQSRAIPRPPHKPGPSEPSGGARLWLPADAGQALLPTLLLGNGAYSVGLRPDGAGQSAWRGHAISRARDDLLRQTPCHAYFIRGQAQTAFSSLSSAPSAHPDGRYSTRLFVERAEFELETEAWNTLMTVWVSPDDDVELRRISLHNLTDQAAEFDLISYFEAVLAPQSADESHPVFSNLFVRAHAADPQCLLLERRPRLEGESGMWVAHFLARGHDAVEPEAELELLSVRLGCARASLLPRRAEMSQLHVLREDSPNKQGAEAAALDTRLDPIASLNVRLRLPARAKRSLTFATAAAADASTVMALVDEYRQAVHLTRSRLMAATLARIRQRELRLSATDLRNIQDMTTPMTISCPRPRASPAERLDRRALWRFAISGDRPILLISIAASVGLRVVRTVLTAHRIWETQGLSCDVVLINQEATSYLMPLQHQLLALRSSVGGGPQAAGSGAGGLHLLQQFEINPHELSALRAYARIELLADGRPLARLLEQALPAQTAGLLAPARLLPEPVPRPWREAAAGRFNADGSAFEFDINRDQLPPRPWANVLANPQFGCIITESGGGHSWAGNSRMNQLTTWSNDPLLDPASEHFLLQDRASDDCFGLLPSRNRNGSAGYHIQHRPGSSLFTQDRPGLRVEALLMVHPQEAMKCLRVRLTCKPDGPTRRLRLLGLAEWQLGAQRRERMTLQCDYAAESQAALAWQLEHSGGFGEACAYLLLAGLPVRQWTCARGECFDAAGSVQMPQHLSGEAGFGLDPCAALLAEVRLQTGQTLEFCWVMGYEANPQAARAQALRWQAPGALAGLEQAVAAHWRPLLSTITVATPDPLFDALVNHWLLYQTLACRLWAKAGFYQAGGAFGYRDQLQDAMALAAGRPDMLRSQLLLHASRQFPEGDVQHWWHAPGGAGVRTHFSDDLLWLPYAAQHYLTLSGDAALLDQSCPFLDGPPVPAGAEDIYCTPSCSSTEASLYEHCARAIDLSLRFGEHGLPLMGSGDWNDGMNRVGHQGRGESVWLGWFLSLILRDWQPLALARGDGPRAEAWAAAQLALSEAINTQAWDGAWFRRAYFDNGHPLGSRLNAECQIDLIAQAWSVFALPPGDARATQAMLSADARLVDRQAGLLRLLEPPLQDAADHAGYIQAYPPGVRENGGQYSHAGVWALMAQAQLGNATRAWEYFCMLSPAHRARSPSEQARYGIEPYVMPGDTYSAAPYTGQGGWSWYTGSAAWLYRAATESLLGLQLQAERFCLRPCLPPPWDEARLSLRLHGKLIEVRILRGDPAGSDLGQVIQPGQWLRFDELADRQRLLLQLSMPQRP